MNGSCCVDPVGIAELCNGQAVHFGFLRQSEQVGCSVVGVASPAGRFTGLVCSLGVTLLMLRVSLFN
jgi:hypothetical protein